MLFDASGALGLGDRDFRLEAFDLQRHRLVHRAALQRQRRFERQEAGELDLDRHRSGVSAGDVATPWSSDYEGDRLARGRRDGHGRRRNTGAGLVDDDEPQLSLVGRVLLLSERGEVARRTKAETSRRLVKCMPSIIPGGLGRVINAGQTDR